MPALPEDRSRIPLRELAWPILVENVLRTSLMSVDTLMLSRYSADAVAAMSLVSQYVFFIQILYMMVSIGSSVLIAQNLGAGRRGEAGQYAVASLVLTAGLAVLISAAVALSTGPVVALYRLEPAVAENATRFLVLYGGLSVFMAVNIAQASILRAWGHARDPMLVNVACLALTVAGNALCLFGYFGFPVLGVAGVAGATAASQAVACLLSAWAIRRRGLALPLRRVREIPGRVYRAILAIGVPTAGENLSYNLSQVAILAMLSGMGTETLATYGIVMAVLRYVFMPGVSIGVAAQIKVGYLVGAGRHGEATGRVYRYFAAGFAISLLLVLALLLLRHQVLGLFSTDPRVLALAAAVLAVSVVLEPGRDFNTIIIPALKGAGDVRFPVYAGIVSMWGISVAGAWLLGVRLGMGIVGVWVAMAADEWLRGLAMLWRWRSGAWKRFSLVAPAGEAAAVAGVARREVEEGL